MWIKCPVYIEEKDDPCDKEVEIHAWAAEPVTYEYPGDPAGFEVATAPCGHAEQIEEEYYDTVMEYLARREMDAREAEAERRARREED